MQIADYPTRQLAAQQEGAAASTALTVRVADSWPRRLIGLLATKALPQDEALLLTPCSSIHCWGMAYPIDVVYLDGSGVTEGARVLAIETVKPWHLGHAPKDTHGVLELCADMAARHHIQVGNTISFR